MSVSISGRQRELLYAVVVDRLTGIDEVWLTVEAGNWERARRLCREYSNLLRLLVDGLDRGEGDSEPAQLLSPPDVIRGAVLAIRRAAAVETPEQRDMRLQVAAVEVDRSNTLDACDEVLETLGG